MRRLLHLTRNGRDRLACKALLAILRAAYRAEVEINPAGIRQVPHGWKMTVNYAVVTIVTDPKGFTFLVHAKLTGVSGMVIITTCKSRTWC